MATFNAPFYSAAKIDRANTSRLAESNINSGEVEFATIAYPLTGTEAANDIINLASLPPGSILLPQLCSVFSADPGTTLTLDVGTAADPDGAADGIVLSNGGFVAFTSVTGVATPAYCAPTPLAADTVVPVDGRVKVFATVASANALTAAVVLNFLLAWKKAK